MQNNPYGDVLVQTDERLVPRLATLRRIRLLRRFPLRSR